VFSNNLKHPCALGNVMVNYSLSGDIGRIDIFCCFIPPKPLCVFTPLVKLSIAHIFFLPKLGKRQYRFMRVVEGFVC
jgi:hypothetical protein